MAGAAADPGVVPPPRRSLAERAPDLLVWGGVLALLLVSVRPVELGNLTRLFSNSQNMREFGHAFLRPDFTDWRLYVAQMWLTVQMALWGTGLAVLIAVPFGLGCARNVSPPWLQQPLRLLMNLLRSIPDLLIGLMFIVAVGLGPLSGVLALAVNTGGVLGKLFSEAVEAIDRGPVDGIRATGASKLQEMAWGVIPQVAPHWTSFALYRFGVQRPLGDGARPDRRRRDRPAAVRDAQRLPVPAAVGDGRGDRRRRLADRPALPGHAQPAAVGPRSSPSGGGAQRRRGFSQAPMKPAC